MKAMFRVSTASGVLFPVRTLRRAVADTLGCLDLDDSRVMHDDLDDPEAKGLDLSAYIVQPIGLVGVRARSWFGGRLFHKLKHTRL